MFVHTVIMVIEPHMKQGRQHKLISTIFLATSVTKKLDHNTVSLPLLIPASVLPDKPAVRCHAVREQIGRAHV